MLTITELRDAEYVISSVALGLDEYYAGMGEAPGIWAGRFQAALTDPTTNKVILGPRQYDPATARFTNPDVFVAGAADVALGSDPLTGNRYLFAGANPVAYYEDGHKAKSKERKLPPELYAPCVEASKHGYGYDTLASNVCRRYREALVTGRSELFFGPSPRQPTFFHRHAAFFEKVSYASGFLAIGARFIPAYGTVASIGLTAISAGTGVLSQALDTSKCRAERVTGVVAVVALGVSGGAVISRAWGEVRGKIVEVTVHAIGGAKSFDRC